MTEYFLHTELVVSEDDCSEFEDRVARFLKWGGFNKLLKGADYELVIAMKGEPFQYSANGPYAKRIGVETEMGDMEFWSCDNIYRNRRIKKDGMMRSFINIWKTPNLKDLDLSRMMIRCADCEPYMDIDKLVVREEQDFIRQVLTRKFSPMKVDDKTSTFQTIRRLNSSDVGRYLFHSLGLLPAMEESGWHMIAQFQHITGPLNTVMEIWQTQPERAQGSMYSVIDKLPSRLKKMAEDYVLNSAPIAYRRKYQCAGYFKKSTQSKATAS
jgi:hypothetical protein